MPAWCFDFLYLLYFLITSRSNIFNFLLNFDDSKLLPPHCLHCGLDGPLAHVFILIICTTHVPQTFVVAIKPDEFISVALSPLHFRSAWKSLPQVLWKHLTQNYATIFHQQQSWTDLHCYPTCTCTAMVYTGRADSPVHDRVKTLRVGEGEWASYCPFRSTTRLDSYSPVTWLFTGPNCLHWSSYTCFCVLAPLPLTRLM